MFNQINNAFNQEVHITTSKGGNSFIRMYIHTHNVHTYIHVCNENVHVKVV